MEKNIFEILVLVLISFLIASGTSKAESMTPAESTDQFKIDKRVDKYDYLGDLLCPVESYKLTIPTMRNGKSYCGYFDSGINQPSYDNLFKEVYDEKDDTYATSSL